MPLAFDIKTNSLHAYFRHLNRQVWLIFLRFRSKPEWFLTLRMKLFLIEIVLFSGHLQNKFLDADLFWMAMI